MKVCIVLLTIIFLSACFSGDKKNNTETQFGNKIIEERINGPANIRDNLNGKVLFTLNDNVKVTCTPLVNNWFTVGLMMDIDTSEFEIDIIKKGRKIILNGKECGKILNDMNVTTGMSHNQAWAYIIGYTHKDNIKSETIIENALGKQISNSGDRSLKAFENFIDNFNLQKDDQFEGYVVYFNYESWLVDQSPMWRIGLVFQNEILIGILHSRPLKVIGTKDYKLDSAFDCLLYNDTKNKEKLIQTFNLFVNSVD